MTEQSNLSNYPGVSKNWQDIFRLIDRAGGVKLPNLKELSFNDRFTIGFNAPAFFLGPFYYLFRRMWRKAISLSAIFTLVVLGVFVIGMESRAGLAVAGSFMWAMLANISYYKIKVLGQDTWL